MGGEHFKTAIAYYGVGLSYFHLCNNSDALDYCSKAVAIYEREVGVNHPETAVMYQGLGYIHSNIGGQSKALGYANKSLEICEKTLGDDHIYTANCYSLLGWVKYRMDNNQEALECFEKCLNITEKQFGIYNPDTAEAYATMGLVYYMTDDNIKAYEYFVNAQEFFKKCGTSTFVEKKITEVKDYLDLIEVHDEEPAKGARDLFLETLTKIGCQYDIDLEDGKIGFAYQGENFVAYANNEGWLVHLWDTHWGQVELYDVDEFARLRQAVNNANINCGVITVYTINEAGSTVDVHSKLIIAFMTEMPELDNYLRGALNEFFKAHHFLNQEMARLRGEEDGTQQN